MRYIRQEIFGKIGKKDQNKLKNSTIAIVGLGALGSVSSELLARAGIGRLILIDRDVVELSNLQRQSLFDESNIGKPKASAAKEKLNIINSGVKIDFFIDDLNYNNIYDLIPINNKSNNGNLINKKINRKKIKKYKINLILDCTDNLETRFLVNDFSAKNKVPFIYSSAVGSKGYVFDIIPNKHNPCLRCFLEGSAQLDTCETFGVLNSITHLISSIQSNEAIKILLRKESNASEHRSLRTRSQLPEKNLLFFDVWKNELLKIKVNKKKNCECCAGNNFEYLNGKKCSRIIKMCGNGIFQIKTKSIGKKQFNELKNKLKKTGKVVDFGYCINFDNKLTIFNDGRALIRAKDEKEAKSLYAKFVGN